MWPLVLLCALCALAEKCERLEAVEGCTVEDGHAHCEAWNIRASIGGLPSCTAKITFSLLADPQKHNHTSVCLDRDADFRRLPHIKEITVRTNRQNFTRLRFIAHDFGCYQNVQNLRVLRIEMLQSRRYIIDANKGMYAHLKYLDTLEIIRGQRAGLSIEQHLLGSHPTMKVLTLKNVQQYSSEFYEPTLDLAYFICKGNLRRLDLSYNDIVTIALNTTCWNSQLLYLNLDHNLLASTAPVKYFLWRVFPMLAGLQVLRASVAGTQYHAGLWDEPNDTHIVDIRANNETKTSPLSSLPFVQQPAPFGVIAGYDYWIKDVLETCKHITYLEVMTCELHNHDDSEAFMRCVDPDVDSYSRCALYDPVSKIGCILLHKCNYSCDDSPPILIPPNLKTLSMNNFFRFRAFTYSTDLNVAEGTNPCKTFVKLNIHPKNALETLDLRSESLAVNLQPFEGGFTFLLSGLHSMKYMNLQNHQIPFLLSRMNISDMRALEELHIGGGRVSEDDTLPRLSLETFTKLSVLNLSYSNLSGFEADVFLKHPHLSVLDLSHNQLTAPSLSSLDLSHTGLTSLNLSHNKLTAIPSSLRQQLESMDGLELYLSGNTFICNCENLAFLEWIQSDLPITLHYSGNHDCADSPGLSIHNIEVDSLHCDWYWKQPLILVFSTLTCVLLIVALATMYKKRFHIANLVFRLQERLCRDDGGASTVYTYDAFVVYSGADADRTWVHSVLQKTLENEFGFRICIHARNFTVGVNIVDNIETAIRNSRKVVLVMSENFLQSDWCVEEVHMTTSIDRKKFVVIMYKDVMFTGVQIPTVVRHVIETTTYIEWHEEPKEAEKLFWKRLRKALYNKHQMSHRLAGEQNPNLLLNEIDC